MPGKITNLQRNELIKLLNGLKSLSEENKAFIEAFLNQMKKKVNLSSSKE